jgi:hypothetical protein
MTSVMNSLEESIADILEAADKRSFPENVLKEITDFVSDCRYDRALQAIAVHLDPFDDVLDYSLVIRSWDLLCQYQRMYIEAFEAIGDKDHAKGNKGLLKLFEKRKKKAIRMKESRQHCNIASRTHQIQSFKAKCN